MKPSGPGLFWGRSFKITNSVPLLVIGLFRFFKIALESISIVGIFLGIYPFYLNYLRVYDRHSIFLKSFVFT